MCYYAEFDICFLGVVAGIVSLLPSFAYFSSLLTTNLPFLFSYFNNPPPLSIGTDAHPSLSTSNWRIFHILVCNGIHQSFLDTHHVGYAPLLLQATAIAQYGNLRLLLAFDIELVE